MNFRHYLFSVPKDALELAPYKHMSSNMLKIVGVVLQCVIMQNADVLR